MTAANLHLQEGNNELRCELRFEVMERQMNNNDYQVMVSKLNKTNTILESHQEVMSAEIKQLQDMNKGLKHKLTEMEKELGTRTGAMMHSHHQFVKMNKNNIGLTSQVRTLTEQLEQKSPGHCLICHDVGATCVTMCGHYICCEKCLHQSVWEDKLKNCPICRDNNQIINKHTVSAPVKSPTIP